MSRAARPVRRTVAAVAGSALFLSVGVGTGFALDRAVDRGATSVTAGQWDRGGGGGPFGWYGGSGESGSSQDQQGQQDQQQSPFSSGSLQRGTADKETATAAQVRGLVFVRTVVGMDQGEAAGTGMILTSDGEVVTNHHVVAGATKIEVTVASTGRTYTAEVVGADDADDVALLRLEDASGLTPITVDQDPVRVGDTVTAVGDAGGQDTLSAASGTVSALDQQITTQAEATTDSERLDGLIEIDADVISGDSGGATYDAEGEVVGMTTAASSGSADITGYAVPIDQVLSIVEDLRDGVQSADYTYGYPGFLGIALSMQSQSPTVGAVYDDTPAAEAGLEAGDVVTAVDGTEVTTATRLRELLGAHEPGDSVRLTWTDATGQTQRATVELAKGPVA